MSAAGRRVTLGPRINLAPLLMGAASFAFLAALWQVLASTGVLNTFLTSSPSRVISALSQQASSGILGTDVGTSMTELGIAFAMAVVVGVAIGLISGWYQSAEYAVSPFIALGYSAPFVALYPVFTVLFGLGRPTVIATAFLLGVFPIIVNTSRGVKNVDPTLINVARSFGAGDLQVFRKVTLPAAVQPIMAGLRMGIGQCLLGVVIGELFAGQGGLGYSISYYGGLLKTDDMLASVVVVGVLGVVLTSAVSFVEHRLDAWRPEVSSA
jgi:ABC-type nitrate/sulfonate/bicarbonate transport system permease component